MFLASDSVTTREKRVRRYLQPDPNVALLLAAVNFEWTVCRAVMFLAAKPNRTLRSDWRGYHSPEKYKDLWKLELAPAIQRDFRPLAEIVLNWQSILSAFNARNRIVHGRIWLPRRIAAAHVEAMLKATEYVDGYCTLLGRPLTGRMPVRKSEGRKTATQTSDRITNSRHEKNTPASH